MDGILTSRAKIVAFYGIKSGEGDSATTTYHRMQGFTSLSTSKNPKEYTRQYVDEEFEQTDVVGYSPSIAYTFDRYDGNAVHEDIARITNGELTGNAALVDILVVDTTDTLSGGGCSAVKRTYAVIPDSEGDSMDAYTYSGSFKVKGDKVNGSATLDSDGMTATFTESSATA